MRAVILAAGFGGRLRPLSGEVPKTLVEVAGRPLIHYSLEALRLAGISDIAVVVGYRPTRVQATLSETHPYLTFIYNEHYAGGNALSLYAARSFADDGPFVLCMGDHLIEPDLVQCLLDDPGEDCVLCVDQTARHASQISDATRVMVDTEGYIRSIGKDLEVWNAVDTGVFKMTGQVFGAVEALMYTMGTQVGISDVVSLMGRQGLPFATCDVSGMLWADVDTPEDYESVNSLLRESYGERV